MLFSLGQMEHHEEISLEVIDALYEHFFQAICGHSVVATVFYLLKFAEVLCFGI